MGNTVSTTTITASSSSSPISNDDDDDDNDIEGDNSNIRTKNNNKNNNNKNGSDNDDNFAVVNSNNNNNSQGTMLKQSSTAEDDTNHDDDNNDEEYDSSIRRRRKGHNDIDDDYNSQEEEEEEESIIIFEPIIHDGDDATATASRVDNEDEIVDTINDDDDDEQEEESEVSKQKQKEVPGRRKRQRQTKHQEADDGSAADASSSEEDDEEEDDNSSGGSSSDDDNDYDDDEEDSSKNEDEEVVKLYKSSRLKGYITLLLAGFIHCDSAFKSNGTAGMLTAAADVVVDVDVDDEDNDGISSNGADGDVASSSNSGGGSYAGGNVMPSGSQRRYSIGISIISLAISFICVLGHIDRITPLEKHIWIKIFRNGSYIELIISSILCLLWFITVCIETSVTGISGDGKGQYNLYYSSWICTLTCFWIFERWCVAAGFSSFQAFITSWPNRAPGWISILLLSVFTLGWYLDLWNNHTALNRSAEWVVLKHFVSVGQGQWQWLIIVVTFTIIPAVIFVIVELFRETNEDGIIVEKDTIEIIVEGVTFMLLTIAWIPTVIIATSPGGAASLIGNAYFFTWLLVVFIIEGFIWYIHDIRKQLHYILQEKQNEYNNRKQRVLQNTISIIQQKQRHRHSSYQQQQQIQHLHRHHLRRHLESEESVSYAGRSG